MSDRRILIARHRPWHEPTEQAKRTGNYAKRVMRWNGLELHIENEPGSVRTFRQPDGSTGEKRVIYPYGYVAGTTGVDGDEVDVFVGPDAEVPFVYVVHARRKGKWAEYDEDKCMLGFASVEDARRAFLLCYDDPRFLGPVTTLTVAAFIDKVRATADGPAMIKALILPKRLRPLA